MIHRMNALRAASLLVAATVALPAPAQAHEPLFGETPVVFGPGVYHPELKFKYLLAGSARRPGGQRMRMFEQEYMLDYGISRYLNVRLMVPYVSNRMVENISGGHHPPARGRAGGTIREASVAGIGDITIRGKYRFGLIQAVGFQLQHSALFGIKLPTGESGHTWSDGRRLDPRDQPGSGKPGILLGYAFDRETLGDTIWASAVWMRDLGGGFRRGDHVEIDAAWGPWLIRAIRAEELALNVAVGIHAEIAGSDRLASGRSANNSYRVAGFHLTPIVTKGRSQYRIGIFVPVLRSGHQSHTDYPYQLRAAFETFF